MFAAGLIARGGTGSHDVSDGFGALVISSLLGAFCGLVIGLILNQVMRYLSMVVGRQWTTPYWAIGSVVCGMLLFTVLEATDGD